MTPIPEGTFSRRSRTRRSTKGPTIPPTTFRKAAFRKAAFHKGAFSKGAAFPAPAIRSSGTGTWQMAAAWAPWDSRRSKFGDLKRGDRKRAPLRPGCRLARHVFSGASPISSSRAKGSWPRNGTTTADESLDTNRSQKVERAHLALQKHFHGTTIVEFRKIEVMRLAEAGTGN